MVADTIVLPFQNEHLLIFELSVQFEISSLSICEFFIKSNILVNISLDCCLSLAVTITFVLGYRIHLVKTKIAVSHVFNFVIVRLFILTSHAFTISHKFRVHFLPNYKHGGSRTLLLILYSILMLDSFN